MTVLEIGDPQPPFLAAFSDRKKTDIRIVTRAKKKIKGTEGKEEGQSRVKLLPLNGHTDTKSKPSDDHSYIQVQLFDRAATRPDICQPFSRLRVDLLK